jgi:hypothetical protein
MPLGKCYTVGLCLGPYEGPMGGAFPYERGTPAPKRTHLEVHSLFWITHLQYERSQEEKEKEKTASSRSFRLCSPRRTRVFKATWTYLQGYLAHKKAFPP